MRKISVVVEIPREFENMEIAYLKKDTLPITLYIGNTPTIIGLGLLNQNENKVWVNGEIFKQIPFDKNVVLRIAGITDIKAGKTILFVNQLIYGLKQ